MRIDAQQVEGPALELGRFGGDGDGALLLGGQADPVEDEVRQVPQQGREAVHGQTLRRDLGGLSRSRQDRWDTVQSLAKGKDGRTPNLDSGFVEQIAAAAKLQFVIDGRGDLRTTLGPEDVVAWLYTVFHSPNYHAR